MKAPSYLKAAKHACRKGGRLRQREVTDMLKNTSFLKLFFGNAFIVGMWYWLMFLVCQRLPDSVLDPGRSRFAARPWERGGRWYRDNLRINLWKDRLPQHVGNGGFSKRNITGVSIDYLDQFIRETCRGEWMHMNNLVSMVVVILINPTLVGSFMTLVVLIANLPFAIVQRYNRFRLLELREKRRKGLCAVDMGQNTVTA